MQAVHASPKLLPLMVAIGLIAGLAAAYFMVYPYLVIKILCFAVLAMSINLLLGYVGLLPFGHAMFFGGSAYVTAYSVKTLGLSPELGILFGVLFAGVIGAMVGALAIRRKGLFFAMITLAFAQMFYFVCVQLPATGGEDGIQAVPRGVLFGFIDLNHTPTLYTFVCTVFLLTMLFVWRLINSPFGNILRAIREHEPRAISLGYDVDRYKLIVFVISTMIAGLAGSTKAIALQFATLTDVSFTTSGEVVFMVLLGGIGTFFGPILGAAIVISMGTLLAPTGLPVPMMLGLMFMVCVMIFRAGIVGTINQWVARQRQQKHISRAGQFEEAKR